MRIHFSIDDVFETLRWCWKNEPESIFDMDFYGTLQKWHEQYGLKCNLYAFYTKNKDFELEDLQKRYKDELNAANWLIISYHGIYSEKKYEDNKLLFENQWNKVLSIFPTQDKIHMSRFHFWNLPCYSAEKLALRGIRGLLTPVEVGRNAYWLNDMEITTIAEKGELCVENILFWKTNIRWDSLVNEELIAEYDMLLNMHSEKMVIFGHEWSFSRQKEILSRFLSRITTDSWEI